MNASLHQDVIDAVEKETAPRFDMAAIELRAQRRGISAPRATRKRSAILAVLLVATPCLAAAAAYLPSPALRQAIAEQMGRWGVRLSGNTFVPGTTVDPRDAAKTAVFHVVLPAGLPNGAKLIQFEANGSSGDSYLATYRLSNGTMAWFSLEKLRPKMAYAPWIAFMEANDHDRLVKAVRYPAHVWQVGDEIVLAASSGLSAGQFATIRRQMGARDGPVHRGPIK